MILRRDSGLVLLSGRAEDALDNPEMAALHFGRSFEDSGKTAAGGSGATMSQRRRARGADRR